MTGPGSPPLARTAAVRVLAALLAFALSGLPRFVLAFAPPAPHRCLCRTHGAQHRCVCRICAASARKARREALASLPPCHRALAERELDQEEAREGKVPECGPPCGEDDERVRPGAVRDPYLRAVAALLTPPPPASPRSEPAGRALWRATPPEPPPPRA